MNLMSGYKYTDRKGEHLHSLGGKPLIGTSTVLSVIAKPLTWWASGMAVGKLGWVNSKNKFGGRYVSTPLEDRIRAAEPVLEQIRHMDAESYVSLLDEAYKAHSVKLKDSAKAGTDLHAELEDWVKGSMGRPSRMVFDPRIEPFVEWSRANVRKFLWSEGHCYSETMWTGGISDAGAELNDGSICIIDFKSSKEAYASQFFQIGGYDLEISENGVFDAAGNLIMRLDGPITRHIIVPFGASKVMPVAVDSVEENREAFKAALSLYKVMLKLQAI